MFLIKSLGATLLPFTCNLQHVSQEIRKPLLMPRSWIPQATFNTLLVLTTSFSQATCSTLLMLSTQLSQTMCQFECTKTEIICDLSFWRHLWKDEDMQNGFETAEIYTFSKNTRELALKLRMEHPQNMWKHRISVILKSKHGFNIHLTLHMVSGPEEKILEFWVHLLRSSCLPIYLSIYLSLCLAVYLSVYQSICPKSHWDDSVRKHLYSAGTCLFALCRCFAGLDGGLCVRGVSEARQGTKHTNCGDSV